MEWNGKRIGKYLIKGLLGKGGMGMVFRAVQDELGREVALKVLPAEMLGQSVDLGKRFIREASVCSKLSHPSIVRVYDYGFEEGIYYYTMELLDATTLEDMLKKEPILPLATTLRVSRDMVDAFLCYHPQGIVHRDLKPSNVMIDSEGRSIITDFGLVKDLGATAITREKVVVGTPMYIAPEMIRGLEVDAATDIYQFGVVLYRMLTGRLPHMGESNRDVFISIIRNEPRPITDFNPSVPKGIENLCMNCLEKEREVRYRTPEELSEDLKLAAKRLPVVRRKAGEIAPLPQPGDSGPAEAVASRSNAATPAALKAQARSSGMHRKAAPLLSRTLPVAAPPPSKTPVWLAAGVGGLLLAGGVGFYLGRGPEAPHPASPAPSQSPIEAPRVSPPPPPPQAEPGVALESAIRELDPVKKAEALDRALQKLPDRARAGKRASEASAAAGNAVAKAFEAVRQKPEEVYSAKLSWPARAARSQHLFDALRYDLCHVSWRGAGPLKVAECLAPVMRIEARPISSVPDDMTVEALLAAATKLFPPPYRIVEIYSTTPDADAFGFENVAGSSVPKPLASMFETSDKVQSVGLIPQLVIPAGVSEIDVVAMTHDLDSRCAFLLRVRPDSSSEPMVIPLVDASQSPSVGWSALVTRLSPSVIPPGTYGGTISLLKLLAHEVPRPNLRKIYLAIGK